MPERRDGDWECPECGTVCFASKETCFKCDKAGGDWTCPDCGTLCFASKTECFKCNPRDSSGDWECPDCGMMVFAYKDSCFKCDTDAGKSGKGGKGKGKGKCKGKPGDWTCPSCEANCFASTTECFKCGEEKPSGASQATKASVTKSAAPTPGDAIKVLAKLSPQFKKAWVAYCKANGEGFSDPCKYEGDFIKEFVEHAGGVIVNGALDLPGTPPGREVGEEEAAEEEAAQPPSKAPKRAPKRPAEVAAAAPTEKKKLTMKKAVAEEIKRLNAEGGLQAKIRMPAVAAALGRLEETDAMLALASLEERQAEVEDPNDFLCCWSLDGDAD